MSPRRRVAPAIETAGVLALALGAIYLALLPSSLPPERPPAPDLVYCLAVAWVIRRPAAVPLWAILALGLLGDLLLSRPVGLGALGLLLASEAVRRSSGMLAAGPFLLEWLAVAAAFLAMMLGMHLALQLAFASGPGLASLLRYAAVTALAYPLIVGLLNLALGIRAPRRGREGRRPGPLA